MLDKQIQIFSVDTGNFYSNHEARLHWANHKLRVERNQLINGADIKTKDGKIKFHLTGTKEFEAEFEKYGISKDDIDLIPCGKFNFSNVQIDEDVACNMVREYYDRLNQIEIKNIQNIW